MLFQDSDISLFNSTNPGTKQGEISLKEKILSSKICQKLFSEEFTYLNYFMNIPSYAGGSHHFGMIDFLEPVEGNSYAIRGWLFSHESLVKELFIIINDAKYPVYAFHLSRQDVLSKLGFLNNSHYCGFVCLLEDCHKKEDMDKIKFEACDFKNEVHYGTF